jgi:hypothetical protein
MEFPEHLQHAISLASMRAKLLFDTYGWTWADDLHHPPTVKRIEEIYTHLAENVLHQAMQVENGETVNCGNSMSGRLQVELVDDHWTFSVQVAGAWNFPLEEDEKAKPPFKVANAEELGLIESD